MGGWIVESDGKFVTIPFDVKFIVPRVEGRFPNEVMLEMDDDYFRHNIAPHAIWIHGLGEFASFSYCGEGLTVALFPSLDQAVKAKRAIDGGGCGGQCVRVHFIARLDPQNSRKAREKQNIRDYVAKL